MWIPDVNYSSGETKKSIIFLDSKKLTYEYLIKKFARINFCIFRKANLIDVRTFFIQKIHQDMILSYFRFSKHLKKVILNK